MANLDISIDAAHGSASLGGAALVFHCHFYNCALQRTIEEGLGNAAADLLRDAATDVVVPTLRSLAPPDPKGVLERAAEIYAGLGFGSLDLRTLTTTGGLVDLRASHYALGWLSVYGERETPSCHFAAGFVAAAARVAFGIEKMEAREVKCVSCGHEVCQIAVEVMR